MLKYFISTALFTALVAGGACASSLVFQGQNAALFPGANPSDTSMLMNSVSKPTPPSSTTTSDLFVQEFAAQDSNRIFNEIYGSGAAHNGTDVASNGDIITWHTDISGNLHVTITSPGGTVELSY